MALENIVQQAAQKVETAVADVGNTVVAADNSAVHAVQRAGYTVIHHAEIIVLSVLAGAAIVLGLGVLHLLHHFL